MNQRRKEEPEPIAREKRNRGLPPVRRPGPLEELFQPEAKDDAFWDIIGFDYI
jgi:hypothetical protein